ncbi:MAG: transcription termination factor NusA [Wolbachia sp.]|nr:transcription termination factor NusA [Wolbachia sp.]MDD9336082.1 transcription termination factor NusA [Wolbachia sp.]
MIASRRSNVKRKSNKSNVIGSLETIRAIEELSSLKRLDFEVVIKALKNAIEVAAYQKYGNENEIIVDINRESGTIAIYKKLTTVSDENKSDNVLEPLDMSSIDVALMKTVSYTLTNGITSEELKNQYEEFKDKVGEIRYGFVKPKENSDIVVDINGTRAFLSQHNQVSGDNFSEGDKIKAYIQSVKRSEDGRQVILSRTHKGFLEGLLRQEVPEIADGLVVIKAIARDAGSRSKVAVFSPDKNIDPVGACVGVRGDRIKTIINELNGEKIDIVSYSSELGQFVIKAITPAEVSRVIIDEDEHCIELVVPEDQLSLAIGKKGQNVKLASELVGWKIEILSTQQESERRSKKLSQCSALFAEALNLDEMMGQLLVTEDFSSVEDIANVSIKELALIEGFNEDIANELHNRANKYLKEENNRKVEELKNLGMEDDVINLSLSIDDKIALSKHGIKTLEDIADLSSYEFCNILSSSSSVNYKISSADLKNLVDPIIMEARKRLGII